MVFNTPFQLYLHSSTLHLYSDSLSQPLPPPPLPSQFVQIERIEAPPTLLFALHKLLLDKEAKSVKEVSGFPEEVRVMGEGVKGMLELVSQKKRKRLWIVVQCFLVPRE